MPHNHVNSSDKPNKSRSPARVKNFRRHARRSRFLSLETLETRQLLAITPLSVHIYDGTNASITSADAARGSSVTAQPTNPIGQNAQPSPILLANIGSNGGTQFATNTRSAVPAPGGGDSYAVFIVGEIQVDNANNPSKLWTFGTFSDDNSRIRIDLDQDGLLEGNLTGLGGIANETVAYQGACCGVVLGPPVYIPDGRYLFEAVFTEGTGGDYGEFFYAPGTPGFSNVNYALIGDDRLGISLDLNFRPAITNLEGDIGNGGTPYVLGSPGVPLEAGGNAVVTDADNPVNVNGATLRVKTLAGAEAADSITPQNNGAGGVLSGATVVGSYTGGNGGADLVITFNASATLNDVNTVVRNILFANNSAMAANSGRIIEWTYNDGQGVGKSTTAQTTLAIRVGDGVATPRVWDGGGDGLTWTVAANWVGDIVPDADDIAQFTGTDPGDINVNGAQRVGAIQFSAGGYNLFGGSLELGGVTNSSGTNTIAAQLIATNLTGSTTGGQLNLTNLANSATLVGGNWTIATGSRIVATTAGANTGLGRAGVDLTGGTLEFGGSTPVAVNSLAERWYPNVFADTNLVIDANAANNADHYLSLAPDSRSTLTTALGPFSTANLVARSPSNLGLFGNRFGATWTGQITVGGALPVGNVSLGTSSDDGSVIYVDVNQNQIFESTELIVDNRGNHGNQSRIGTVNLPAAGSYNVFIGYFESSGGGSMEARYASGSAIAYASQTIINPSAQPGVWTSPTVASGNVPNNIRVLNDSTVVIGATLPSVGLGQLTMAAGRTLLTQSVDNRQGLSFSSVVLNGSATLASSGNPNISLSTITDTAPGAGLTFNGNATINLPTNNSYSGVTTINSGVLVVASAPVSLGQTVANTVVNSGGTLVLKGGVTYVENISIAGSGTSGYNAALFKDGGGNVFLTGQVDVAANARIWSQGGNELFLDGGVSLASGTALTMEVDNRINVRTIGITGDATTSIIVQDGRDVLDLEVNSPNFSGSFVLNQGRIEAHVPQAFGNSTGSTTVNGNDASVWVRNGHNYAENFFIQGDGRDTEGAIRSEGSNNTISGVVTLTGNADIFVNNSNLTLTQGLQGAFELNKTGANPTSRLILQQNSAASNVVLSFGQLQIHTEQGLGGTSELAVGSGRVLEFSGNLTFDAADALDRLLVTNGTLASISGTTTLDIPIELGLPGNIIFDGAGDLIVKQGFGNPNITPSATLPVTNALALWLDAGDIDGAGNGTVGDPVGGAVVNSWVDKSGLGRNATLTNGNPIVNATGLNGLPVVNFTNDQLATTFDFNNLGANYTIMAVSRYTGGDNERVVGSTTENFLFGHHGNLSDRWHANGWIYPPGGSGGNANDLTWGIYSGTIGPTADGFAGGPPVANFWSDGVQLVSSGGGFNVGDYKPGRLALGAGNGGGFGEASNSEIAEVLIFDRALSGLERAQVEAYLNAKYNLTLVSPSNNVIKNGTGTVTLEGNNSYNGTTTINAGMLVAGHDNALGLDGGDVQMSPSASLGFANNVTIDGENVTGADGQAAGKLGTIVNVSGNNTFLGNITASSGPIAQNLIIASAAGQLTIGQAGVHVVNAGVSQLTFDGPGQVVVNSQITNSTTATDVGVAQAYLFNGNTTRLPGDPNQLATKQQQGEVWYPNEVDLRNFWGMTLEGLNNAGNPTDPNTFGVTVVGVLKVNPGSTVLFRNNTSDDAARILIDLNRNGIFEGGAEDPYAGDRGGNFTSGVVAVPANQYVPIALMMREGTGGSRLVPEISVDNGATWQRFSGNMTGAFFGSHYEPAMSVVKTGTGTTTLVGNNIYSGETTVSQGVLVVSNNAALGTTAEGTTVLPGATLALQSSGTDLTIAEPIIANGAGAAGQVGAVVNLRGNNTINAATPLSTPLVAGTQLTIGSVDDPGTAGVDTLTIGSSGIDLIHGKLVVGGSGNTIVNGSILGYAGQALGADSLVNLPNASDGFSPFTAAGQSFDAWIDNDGVNSWLLIGRGRQGWQFDTDGQGSIDAVSQNLGTTAAFGPAAYSDAIVNSLLAQAGINNTGVELRIRRATNTTGTAYQEARWRNFTSPNFTFDFDQGTAGLPVQHEIISGTGAPFGPVAVNTRDTWPPGGNDFQRIFTWPWANHNNQQGFSFGSSADAGTNNDPTNFLWENNGENHAIPYAEVYIRATSAVPLALDNSLLKTGAGTLSLNNGGNNYAGGTTISQGTILVGHPDALGSGNVTINDANTGASNTALLATVGNSGNPINNNITVANQGTGTTSIGSTSFNSGLQATIYSGTLTLNKATTLTAGNNDRTTYTNVISGNVGTLTVTGGARTTIEANNTFVGDVNITGAGTTLQVGPAGNQIPDASNVTVGAGTFLTLNNDGEAINGLSGSGTIQNIVGGNTLTIGAGSTGGNFFFSGVFADGSGPLSLVKTGTTIQYVTGANSYSGLTTINGGYLVAQNSLALGSTAGGTVVTNPGTLQLEALGGVNVNIVGEPLTISGLGVNGNRGALASWSGVNSFSGPITIAGNTSIHVNSGSLELSGVISGAAGLTNAKTGAGSLTYSGSGSNTFAGTTILDSGILTLAKTGGAVAIAGPVQMGGGNANQPYLRMAQSNQFGPGVVMTQANSQGNWVRFDLLGTSQTLAGIQDSVGGLVIQNGGIGVGSATDATLTINNTANFSIASHVRDFDNVNSGGKLNIVKNGAGTFTMSQLPSNQSRVTYTGTTVVNSGVLVLTGLGEAGNTYRSPTTVNAGGTLRTAGAITLQTVTPTSLTLNGGVYEHTASQWVVWTGLLTVNANSTINVINNGASNQVFFDGGITGTNRTLTINNTGSATTGVHFRNNTSGINSYSGALIVNGGEIAIGNSAATWFANTDVTLNGAQLQLGAAAFAMAASGASLKSLNGNGLVTSAGSTTTLTLGSNNGSGTYSGTIINGTNGALSLIKTGTGTQVLTSANSFTGTTQVTGGGVLEVADLGAIGQGTGGNWFAVQGGATFRYTGSGTQTTTARDIYWNSGAATFDITSPTGVAIFNTTGGATRNQTMTKLGPGRMTLASSVAGNLLTSGAINLNAGSLEFQPNTAGTILSITGPITGAGGTTILATGNGIVRNDNLSANWSANLASLHIESGATFDLRGNQVRVDALTGSGSIINSYYRADSGIQGETLTVGVNNGSGNFGGMISGSSTVDTSANGRISLSKIGSGTQLLGGANTFTGPTLVANGTLGGDGSLVSTVTVNSGATLAPGSSGPGDFATGDVNFQAGSIFRVELNGPTAGTGYDQLIVTGAVTLSGATLTATSGATPAPGQVFRIIANDGVDVSVGTFANGVPDPTYPASGDQVIVIGGHNFYLTYSDPLNRFGTGNDVALIRNRDLNAVDDDFGSILTNAVFTGNVKDNDIDLDGDAVMSIVSGPAHGTLQILNPLTGEFTYTPSNDYTGSDSFTYRLFDGEFSDTATVTFSIDRFVIDGDRLIIGGTDRTDRIIVSGNGTVRFNNQLLPSVWPGGPIVVYGNGGNDTITASNVNFPIEFYGGAGNDYLAGGTRDDILDGGEGNDRLLGGSGRDILLGGGGADRLYGGAGDDYGFGDHFLDEEFGEVYTFAFYDSQGILEDERDLPLSVSSSPGADTINGDAGNDVLYGGPMNDRLNGGAGNDLLRGGVGNDVLDGGNDDDILLGETGGDTLYGRNGNDVLIGGLGIDTLFGGNGDDLIYGGDLSEGTTDEDLAQLWLYWRNFQQEDAIDELFALHDDDDTADSLHGERDIDWYVMFAKDKLRTTAEAKAPNQFPTLE